MIDMTIDNQWVRALERMARRMPEAAQQHARRAFTTIGEQFLTLHYREKLRGRPGLKMQQGQAGLFGSRQTETTGSSLGTIRSLIFIGGTATRYARVHELGTKGKGGSLPDITPRRGKFLVFEVDGQKVFAKSVSIPARLGWFETWDKFEDVRMAILGRMLDSVVKEAGSELA